MIQAKTTYALSVAIGVLAACVLFGPRRSSTDDVDDMTDKELIETIGQFNVKEWNTLLGVTQEFYLNNQVPYMRREMMWMRGIQEEFLPSDLNPIPATEDELRTMIVHELRNPSDFLKDKTIGRVTSIVSTTLVSAIHEESELLLARIRNGEDILATQQASQPRRQQDDSPRRSGQDDRTTEEDRTTGRQDGQQVFGDN